MPTVAGAHRDLLGAVGMAVEARLADQELDAPAELCGNRIDGARTSSRPAPSRARPIAATPVGARYSPKIAAQTRAPFARRHARLGAGDRRLHDVAAFLGGATPARRALSSTALASRCSRQALSCSTCSASIFGSTTMIAPSPAVSGDGSVSVQRVDADDDLLARLDAARRAPCCSRPAAASCSRSPRRRRPSSLDGLQLGLGLAP